VRKSKKEAAQTREAIVAAAADHIRRTGIAEASLADVMAAAGLTHGGFAALGSEMAKAAATAVLESLFAMLAEGASGPEARGQAIITLSTMIGAMTLARITSDTPLSEEILNRAKDHLHQ
jgi:TetR/AcrR family transcriptional repressor of nem operon